MIRATSIRSCACPAPAAFTGGHPVPRADSGGSVLCDGQQLLQLR